MAQLCHPRLARPLRVAAAALIVSGENDPNSIRQNKNSLLTISSRQVQRIYNYWLDYGALPCDKFGKYLKRRKGSKKSKWDDAADAKLKQIVDECPVLYLDEISKKLKAALNKKFSSKDISVRLRKKLKYSRKVVYEKATQQIKRDKLDYIAETRYHIKKPEMAIFIDESNKDRKAARRKYGWSPIGEPVHYKGNINNYNKYINNNDI